MSARRCAVLSDEQGETISKKTGLIDQLAFMCNTYKLEVGDANINHKLLEDRVGLGVTNRGGEHGHKNVLLARVHALADLVGKGLLLGHLDVLNDETGVIHEGKVLIVGNELVLVTGDLRNVDVVGSRGHVLVLLSGEAVNTNDVHLGVSVLSGLGGTDAGHLARVSLDLKVSSLLKGSGFHRDEQRHDGLVLICANASPTRCAVELATVRTLTYILAFLHFYNSRKATAKLKSPTNH